MSRHLPDRPSLEYLKKEAKALLEDIQQRNPEAQLADALHQLAREYGFDSWAQAQSARQRDRGQWHIARESVRGSLDRRHYVIEATSRSLPRRDDRLHRRWKHGRVPIHHGRYVGPYSRDD